jgi:ligand-binding SRPBCC domain-containing protein
MPVFRTEVLLPRPRDEVFPFFADAANLEVITPPWLSFRILTPLPVEMRVGTRLDYRIRIRGIPVRWRTAITAWDPPRTFTDSQEKGPYRRWIHTHTFEEREGGTHMVDEVDYAVFGGWIADRLLVRRDVRRIFDYRRERMRELFPPATPPRRRSGR